MICSGNIDVPASIGLNFRCRNRHGSPVECFTIKGAHYYFAGRQLWRSQFNCEACRNLTKRSCSLKYVKIRDFDRIVQLGILI